MNDCPRCKGYAQVLRIVWNCFGGVARIELPACRLCAGTGYREVGGTG